MSSRSVSFRLGADGWTLGVRLDTGPLFARARAASSLRTDAAVFLGPDDRHVGAPPTVRRAADTTLVAHTGAGGAFVQEADDPRSARPLGPARDVALAVDGRRAQVVLTDREGLSVVPWRVGHGLPAGEAGAGNDDAPTALAGAAFPSRTRLPVDRADVRSAQASLSGSRLLVLYALPDPVLGVLYTEVGRPAAQAGAAEARDVRLRLPAPVVHIDTEWVGEQTGVALLLENGQTYACVLDANGRTRVKPYAVDSKRRDGLSPRVLWAERGFRVAMPCTQDETVRIFEVGASQPEVVVRGVAGSPDAVFFAQRYVFATVHESTDVQGDVELRLRSVGRQGDASQTLACSLRSDEQGRRLRDRAWLERMQALESELRGSGYRVGAEAGGVRRRGASVELLGPTRVAVEGKSHPRGDMLEVVFRDPSAPLPQPRFPRLREFFGLERDLSDAEEGHVRVIKGSLPHVSAEVEADSSGFRVRLVLEDLPSVAALAGLLRALRASCASPQGE